MVLTREEIPGSPHLYNFNILVLECESLETRLPSSSSWTLSLTVADVPRLEDFETKTLRPHCVYHTDGLGMGLIQKMQACNYATMDKFIGADSLSHLYLLHVKPERRQVSELTSFLCHAEHVSVWNGPSIQSTSMEWDQQCTTCMKWDQCTSIEWGQYTSMKWDICTSIKWGQCTGYSLIPKYSKYWREHSVPRTATCVLDIASFPGTLNIGGSTPYPGLPHVSRI